MKDNMDHAITMESSKIEFLDFSSTLVISYEGDRMIDSTIKEDCVVTSPITVMRNQEVVDPSQYELKDQTMIVRDDYEVLLADSTKSKNGFTFTFKGENKEVPTQQYRFMASSPIEALSALYAGHIYLLTRVKDGAEIYRRPYDSWK